MRITRLTTQDFNKWKNLIEKLIQKTESNRARSLLEWRRTSRKNEFILSFTSHSIVISSSAISIVNDEGEIVDSVEIEDMEKINNHLENNYEFKNLPDSKQQKIRQQYWSFSLECNYLYNISRKEAMEVDAAFDSILHELIK